VPSVEFILHNKLLAWRIYMNAEQIHPLTKTQCQTAIDVMVKAFFTDTFINYLAPDEKTRSRVLPAFISIVVNYCFLYGEVWTTSTISGAACWLPPNKTTPTFWGMLRTGMFTVPLQFGWAGFQRFNDVVSYTEIIHKQVVSAPHWYLWGIGVDPAYQGKGIGGDLIQPVLKQADAAGHPCYLETQNSSNLPFYQKHGFEVASDGKTSGGLQVWAMLRKPRA
jgi:GNAT superfamily N-acetyltransferase